MLLKLSSVLLRIITSSEYNQSLNLNKTFFGHVPQGKSQHAVQSPSTTITGRAAHITVLKTYISTTCHSIVF